MTEQIRDTSPAREEILRVEGLCVRMLDGRKETQILHDISFTIREGARFHPDPCFGENAAVGRDVTADDVVYSLKRLGSKANASSGIVNDVQSVL